MKDDFEYHITFPTANNFSSAAKEPVIVLFGWAGCSDRHLSKYSKVYEKLGYITMRFVTLPAIMSPRSVNQKKIYNMAEKVVSLMQDMALNEHPIFFHCFSNGGSIVYQHVSDILRQKHAGEFQVKGCIFDSAPAKVSASGFLKAAVAVTQGSVVWKYVVAIFVLLQNIFFDLCNSFWKMITGIYTRKRLWNALLEEPNICPQLFLFSKNDDICNWESIQEFADGRSAKGVKVSTVLWDDSAHVQHMLAHEEAYCCAVCTFVEENARECVDTFT